MTRRGWRKTTHRRTVLLAPIYKRLSAIEIRSDLLWIGVFEFVGGIELDST